MSNIKLTKIEVANYRSCVSTEFEPNDGLTALIGPNGSGKTNILSAFQLLASMPYAMRSNIYRRQTEDPFSSACSIKVKFLWCGKPIYYEASINLVNNERNEDEIISANEKWMLFSITGSKKKLPLSIEYFGPEYSMSPRSKRNHGVAEYIANYYGDEGIAENVMVALSDVLKFIKNVTYYSASIFTNPSSCPISFEVESERGARRGISITGHKKFLYDLYSSYKSASEEYEQFLDLVGPEGVNLIDGIAFQEIETSSSSYKVSVGGRITTKEKKNNLIIPNFLISENALSPSQLSEGTFRTLALVFYLITDKGSLMLIEEPEVCVHHGLLSSIIELIKMYSKDKQIIISTHSDQILDSLDLESLFKVSRGVAGTTVQNVRRSLSSDDLKALKDYLRDEGGLGEYWKHGEL